MRKDLKTLFTGIGFIAGMIITHSMYPWMPRDGFDLVIKISGLLLIGGPSGAFIGYWIARIFQY